MRYERKKVTAFLVVYIFLSLVEMWADSDGIEKINARVQVEIGIDSREQRYYKPDFTFEWPLSFATFVSQIFYYQIMDGSLQGRIDYWVAIGLEKDFGDNLRFEGRLNHMCRHITSVDSPVILNLNEVVGRLWLLDKNFKLGIGTGTYTGGNAGYKTLLQFNGELPHLFGSELSLQCELKVIDFKEILHEAELYFSLSKSTDIFIKNSRHYELEDNTYIGVRMKSAGTIEKYIDSLNVSTDIYPFYEDHKVAVEGEFKLVFFKTPTRRVIGNVGFTAPVSRGTKFLGDFYPEKMVYLVSMQYLSKIKESLYLGWLSKYSLSMPVDKNERFSASLATGIAMKNQVYFERIEKKLRFDVFGGYNFKHKFETEVKLGVSFVKTDLFNISSDLHFGFNKEKNFADFRLFFEYGRRVTFRPFIGVERITYLHPRQPTVYKFPFGFELFRWFN